MKPINGRRRGDDVSGAASTEGDGLLARLGGTPATSAYSQPSGHACPISSSTGAGVFEVDTWTTVEATNCDTLTLKPVARIRFAILHPETVAGGNS